VGGPLENIQDWARHDLASQILQPLSFYDRHPMFSEPIYGRIVRDRVHDWFSSDDAQALGNSFLRNNLVVICLPSLDRVIENLAVEDQMDGVITSIGTIYGAYQQTLISLKDAYPYNVFHYNYEIDRDLEDLEDVITAHQVRWNRKQNGRLA
jgi:hypothetical protein